MSTEISDDIRDDMGSDLGEERSKWRFLLIGLLALFVALWLLAVYWSSDPDVGDIRTLAAAEAAQQGVAPVAGFTMTTAAIHVADTLLHKAGGYLANDIMPPGLLMDNMPAWEYGALEQLRDFTLSLRRDFSRSQSQSQEDADLSKAQNKFNIDHRKWQLPSAEGEYGDGIKALQKYRQRLTDQNSNDGQFFTRADNLREWLRLAQKRTGSLSQRLSASVGQELENIDLAGDTSATSNKAAPSLHSVRTSWWKIDDAFWEARGSCWALLQFLKAVEVDFADVLKNKNAEANLRQIIRELEATQDTVWSPMILNGRGFGLLANHSLVMANYISRANAALIDLADLLYQG